MVVYSSLCPLYNTSALMAMKESLQRAHRELEPSSHPDICDRIVVDMRSFALLRRRVTIPLAAICYAPSSLNAPFFPFSHYLTTSQPGA
jgi:hypothetical protein